MKKKIVTIHQPYFMPWLGFFDKISKADIYIVFDTASCPSKNTSMLNRNKIKMLSGQALLTVPVHSSIHMSINQAAIDNSQDWREDHLKTLFFNYKKAKNFTKIYKLIEKVYQKKHKKISDLNLDLIQKFMPLLGVKTKIVLASNLKAQGSRNDLLIDLIQKINGDTYLSGLGAKNYMDLRKFKKAGIEVVWQDFQPPEYKQLWGDFIPNLSALDYLFCDGRPLSKG